MPSRAVFVAAFLATVVKAQVPAYIGQLLLEPGLNAGKCLTASSNSDGATATIQPCTGTDAQKWTFTNNHGSINVFENKCLDVKDGAGLQIWTCSNNGNPNQNFWYSDDYRLAWTNHGKCLDLTNGIWNTGYMANNLPSTSQNGQFGINNCGTSNSQDSKCQTVWINSADDFCLWAPPSVGNIGDTEREEVAWCTRSGRGTRAIPNGTLKGVHFVKTPDYVQVTGVGDFTKINIPSGDDGGELDSHGADGKGNPIGGLIFGNTFGNALQYHEWTSFISDTEFCFRACVGPNAARNCQHIYDLMGCYWNMPANYDAGVFENCEQIMSAEPMGVYGSSTWYQGVNPTPAAHPPAKSSNCVSLHTVGVTPAQARRDESAL
ncbi:hypothetical protein D9758_017189 [Tetrapyrgos nigripes]|uniref:Ricin B lectin domain-containing protein n=1 Tax=Tetrapyrgos nigripes TaxID=182062 RepID=A0A8H5BY79_9AGAR|nr:hypothetical protein D9758_017189 [Tetrapyrgos nigripes]